MLNTIPPATPPVPINLNGHTLFISQMRWLDHTVLSHYFSNRFGSDADGVPLVPWNSFDGLQFLYKELRGIYCLLVAATNERENGWNCDEIAALAKTIADRLGDPDDPMHDYQLSEWQAAFPLLIRVVFDGEVDWQLPGSIFDIVGHPVIINLSKEERQALTIKQIRSIFNGYDGSEIQPVIDPPTITFSQLPVPHNRIARFFDK